MGESITLRSQKSRPTIGFLTYWQDDPFIQPMEAGVHDAAKEQDVNLITFAGGLLQDPENYGAQANVLYDLAGAENVDGLVVWGGTLAFFTGPDAVRDLCDRYHPLPIVSIALPLEGIPCVLADNYPGMRDVITHLIRVHDYRKLVFIRGPEGHPEAEERYRAYVDILAEHDIRYDPTLVAPGHFSNESGAAAVELLIHGRKLRPGIDFEVIVAADDETASGAMQALHAQGVRIPNDVAVTGFDDEVGLSLIRPLTTVPSLVYEQGRQAIKMVLALLQGEELPEQTLLSAKTVVRRSCGCLSSAVIQAAAGSEAATYETLEAALATHGGRILTEIEQAAGASASNLNPGWAERLLEAFSAELEKRSPGAFLSALDEALGIVVAVGGELAPWQGVLSALRRHMRPLLPNNDLLSQAEDLWQQARVLISEAMQSVLVRRRLEVESLNQVLRETGQALLAVHDLKELTDSLVEKLPPLGVVGCYLALYEDPASPAEWSRLILAYDEKGCIALPDDGLRFPSRRLLPDDVSFPVRRYNLVVEPLYFREKQLGFALLEAGSSEWMVCGALHGWLSGALEGVSRVQQLARRAVQLQTAAEVSRAATSVLDLGALLQQVVTLIQQRFDLYYVGLFLVEPAWSDGRSGVGPSTGSSVWIVLRAASGQAARQMLAQDHRLEIGGNSMIGRCVADHQVLVALDAGEEAMRFDNPLLPETRSEMALPLVTREGAIGALSIQSQERLAFGEVEIAVFETLAGQLANAVSNARAYEQVAEAYDEIQRLNERLEDENLRMMAELEVTQRLQQMLLPTEEELRRIEELDIAGFMEPAEEVGGDYYDVLNHNGQVKIGIGDVTGHGLESGVVMLMLQTAVRTLMTSDEQDPVRFLSILNRLLRENTQRMQVSKSMTLALLDYQMGHMRVSGQHEQVIVVRKGGQVELKDTLDLGFPLGLVDGVAKFVQEMPIDLQPGDGIVLYSDGITEAENEAKEFYGVERLCQVVGAHWDGTSEEVKDAVVGDIWVFIGNQKVYDDITLVVVKQR